MTPADLRWRIGGALLALGAAGANTVAGKGAPLTLLFFLAALLGIVLVINGKRVAILWRAGRRGHGATAAAVRAARARQRGRATLD